MKYVTKFIFTSIYTVANQKYIMNVYAHGESSEKINLTRFNFSSIGHSKGSDKIATTCKTVWGNYYVNANYYIQKMSVVYIRHVFQY